MRFNSLKDVLQEQLEDLYSAETQLVGALPKMAQAAHNEQLRDAFQTHLEETRGHVNRIEEALGELGVTMPTEVCKGMQGLIAEGEEMIQMGGDPLALDAALIAAAQRVEHYEIAAYGCARTYAEALDRMEDARLLQQTLDEEAETDRVLTAIALTVVNPDAGARRTSASRLADVDVTPSAAREVPRAAEPLPRRDREEGGDTPYAGEADLR